MNTKQFDGHTPGPWEMCYDKGSTRDVISLKHGGICTVRRAGRHDDATYHANARLIEAAPDLLREVKRLQSALDLAMAANADVKRIADESWRMEKALKRLLRRHEEEVNGGSAISGEEWEEASFSLPNKQITQPGT